MQPKFGLKKRNVDFDKYFAFISIRKEAININQTQSKSIIDALSSDK